MKKDPQIKTKISLFALHANHVCCTKTIYWHHRTICPWFPSTRCQDSEAHTFDAFWKSSVFDGKSFKAPRWCTYFTLCSLIWPILTVFFANFDQLDTSCSDALIMICLNIIRLDVDLNYGFLALMRGFRNSLWHLKSLGLFDQAPEEAVKRKRWRERKVETDLLQLHLLF